jgi:Restriction endonuclease
MEEDPRGLDVLSERRKARELKKTQWWLNHINNGVCYYCRQQVGRKNLTMDHIIPVRRGGKSTKGNIVPACKECNSKKQSLLPLEWEDYLQTLNNPVDL